MDWARTGHEPAINPVSALDRVQPHRRDPLDVLVARFAQLAAEDVGIELFVGPGVALRRQGRAQAFQEVVALAAQGAALHARIDALAPAPHRELGWTGMLETNLAARLHMLVDLCVETRSLRQHIDAGVHGRLPEALRRLPGEAIPAARLHQDRGMALLSAFAAVVAVLACCAFWILSGWPDGFAAPMMAAVLCCFFAGQDDPAPFIQGFLKYTIYSIPAALLYLLAILPAVHGFETLVLACAPVFLVLGVLVARPATMGRALPFMFGICGALLLVDTHNADALSYVNGMLAQLAGLAAAVLATRMLRSVGAGWTARRVLKAGWRELARLGSGKRVSSPAEFSARMVDRVGLLTPRLAQANAPDLQAADALRDLRVGLNMSLLQSVRARLAHHGSDAAIAPVMRQLSRHFARLPAVARDGEARLLAALDNALRAVCLGPAEPARREALAALTGMRRDLFPQARPWQP